MRPLSPILIDTFWLERVKPLPMVSRGVQKNARRMGIEGDGSEQTSERLCWMNGEGRRRRELCSTVSRVPEYDGDE